MAAPAFRIAGAAQYTANSVTNPTSLSPVKQASIVNGDLMLLFTESRSNTATCTTPTGWTLLSPTFPLRSGTASGGTIYVFGRIADGTATDSPTVTWSGLSTGTTGDSCGARIHAWSNAQVALDGVSTATDQAATLSWLINAATTSNPNSIVIGVSMKVSDTSQTATFTNLTKRSDDNTQTGTGHITQVGDKLLASAGGSGSSTVTPSNTTSSRVLAISFGIQMVAQTVPFDAVNAAASPTLAISAQTAIAASTSAVASPTLALSAQTTILSPPRVNLTPDPSFELGTGSPSASGGALGAGSSVVRSTAQADDGSYSYALTWGASPAGSYFYFNPNTAFLGVASHTYSCYLRVRAAKTGQMRWYFFDGDQGSGHGTSAVQDINFTAGVWKTVQFDGLTLGSTPGGVMFEVLDNSGAWVAGDTNYIDSVVIEEAATSAGYYFSGTDYSKASNAQSSATLTLSYPITMPLDPASAQSSATAALTAKTTVVLSSADSAASPTLAITAPTQIPLDSASAQSSTSLAVSATTRIPLAASSAVASDTLALSAPTQVTLGAASAQSSATLALTAVALLTLSSSNGLSTTTLVLTAPARISASTSAQSSASLALSATTQVPCNSSVAQSSATLALSATTQIVLGASSVVASNTLTLSAVAQVPLGASTAQSVSTLAVTALTQIPLGAASALAASTLTLSAGLPGSVVIPLDATNASSGTTLALRAPVQLMAPLRRNLVGNPSFENGSTSPYADLQASYRISDGGDFSVSTAWSKFGTRSLHLRASTTWNGSEHDVTIGWLTPSDRLPITGGKTYTFSYYANFVTVPANASLRAYYVTYDAGGNDIGHAGGSVTAVLGEQRLSQTFTAPANAVALTLLFYFAGGGVQAVTPEWYIDGVMVEEASSLGTYIDTIVPNPATQANGTSSASLALTAPTQISSLASSASSSATLSLAATPQLALSPSGATSSAALDITVPTTIPLSASSSSSSAGLSLSSQTYLSLVSSNGSSLAVVTLAAPAQVTLTVTGVSDGSLQITLPWAPKFAANVTISNRQVEVTRTGGTLPIEDPTETVVTIVSDNEITVQASAGNIVVNVLPEEIQAGVIDPTISLDPAPSDFVPLNLADDPDTVTVVSDYEIAVDAADEVVTVRPQPSSVRLDLSRH